MPIKIVEEIKGRAEIILAGLNSQNEQAQFEGRNGFWVQADAVFIESDTPNEAITAYRDKLSKAQIACCHNHFCGDIIASKRRQWISAIRKDPSLHESLKTALDKDCP